MRWQKLAPLVLAVAVTACSGSQGRPLASSARSPSLPATLAARCATPTATAATYVPVVMASRTAPRVGPITFLAYPYQPRYPTKVLIHRVGEFRGSLSLTGYNCRDGRPLRFWYRLSGQRPAAPIRRLSEGDLVATLPFYPAPLTDYAGYMLFTEAGRWDVVVSEGTTVIGNIAVTVATKKP